MYSMLTYTSNSDSVTIVIPSMKLLSFPRGKSKVFRIKKKKLTLKNLGYGTTHYLYPYVKSGKIHFVRGSCGVPRIAHPVLNTKAASRQNSSGCIALTVGGWSVTTVVAR